MPVQSKELDSRIKSAIHKVMNMLDGRPMKGGSRIGVGGARRASSVKACGGKKRKSKKRSMSMKSLMALAGSRKRKSKKGGVSSGGRRKSRKGGEAVGSERQLMRMDMEGGVLLDDLLHPDYYSSPQKSEGGKRGRPKMKAGVLLDDILHPNYYSMEHKAKGAGRKRKSSKMRAGVRSGGAYAGAGKKRPAKKRAASSSPWIRHVKQFSKAHGISY